jgi:hypothetical protein
MAHLDPVSEQSISFVFPSCQAHVDGADLVVAVPAPATCRPGEEAGWGAASEIAHAVVVECEPGPRRRTDRSEYPSSPALAHQQAVLFRFRGAVTYGRVLTSGSWALSVQGLVRSLAGLHAGFSRSQSVLVEPRPQPQMAAAAAPRPEGPLNGPHLPYP